MPTASKELRTVTIRRVGGSLMMTLPRHAVDLLHLRENVRVAYEITDGRLIVDPAMPVRPRYRLDDLLGMGDASVSADPAEAEWLEAPDVGQEVIP